MLTVNDLPSPVPATTTHTHIHCNSSLMNSHHSDIGDFVPRDAQTWIRDDIDHYYTNSLQRFCKRFIQNMREEIFYNDAMGNDKTGNNNVQNYAYNIPPA